MRDLDPAGQWYPKGSLPGEKPDSPAAVQVFFGTELVLDLRGCDPTVIGSAERLAELATQLCKLIKMRPYGNPIIERFGLAEAKTAGYTLVQLIETSSIVAHFSEAWRTVYLNIFSCQPFDVDLAAGFVQGYLDADRVRHTVLIRR